MSSIDERPIQRCSILDDGRMDGQLIDQIYFTVHYDDDDDYKKGEEDEEEEGYDLPLRVCVL